MLKKPIPIRSHHIGKFTPEVEESSVEFAKKFFLDQPIDYKTGTRVEQQAFINAIAQTAEAIRSGRFVDVSEGGPDVVCSACLRIDCPDSGIGSKKETEIRTRALEAIVGELVLEQTRRDMTRGEGHEFICDRMDFLIGEKRV